MAIQRLDTNARLSQATVANGFVFTAGVVPDDATQDITGQTQQVLAKIADLLRRAGSDKTKLMSATIGSASTPAASATHNASRQRTPRGWSVARASAALNSPTKLIKF